MLQDRAGAGLIRSTILVCFLLLLSNLSNAADHFIRDGATGTSCSDWTTANACDALPATLVRGDTYYIADGNYPNYTFNDPVSAGAVITIKKATIADHGTNTGWQDAFGDGQAVFDGGGGAPIITFTTSNYVFDGKVRTGPKSGHGFKIGNNANASVQLNIEPPSNITIRFTELVGTGLDSGDVDRNLRIIAASNVTFSHGYIHDSGNTPILMGGSNGVNGFTLEHSVIARNSSDPVNHSEGISDSGSDNVIIRYNAFEDIEGTGQIVVLNRGGGPSNNWEIYGNVFMYHAGNPFNRDDGNGDGAIAVINNQSASNWKIYNNSFINLNQGLSSRVAFVQSTGSNREVRNNLWFNCDDASHNGSLTASNNYYINTGHGNEVGIQTSPTTDPFVNWPGENYHLVQATNPGMSLPAPFNTDPDNVVRGGDGTWDRGAFEFDPVARPQPPPNVRAVVR